MQSKNSYSVKTLSQFGKCYIEWYTFIGIFLSLSYCRTCHITEIFLMALYLTIEETFLSHFFPIIRQYYHVTNDELLHKFFCLCKHLWKKFELIHFSETQRYIYIYANGCFSSVFWGVSIVPFSPPLMEHHHHSSNNDCGCALRLEGTTESVHAIACVGVAHQT